MPKNECKSREELSEQWASNQLVFSKRSPLFKPSSPEWWCYFSATVKTKKKVRKRGRVCLDGSIIIISNKQPTKQTKQQLVTTWRHQQLSLLIKLSLSLFFVFYFYSNSHLTCTQILTHILLIHPSISLPKQQKIPDTYHFTYRQFPSLS